MAAPSILSQEKQEPKKEPEHKMVQFHMALLKRGPKWTATQNEETKRLLQQHVEYVTSCFDSGKAVIAGPLTDGGEIAGVFVFRAQSADEAKAWAEADPSVTAEFQIAEMHPWWSEDIFGKPAKPLKLTQNFSLSYSGRKMDSEKTPATEEFRRVTWQISAALAEMKKLVAAGPFR